MCFIEGTYKKNIQEWLSEVQSGSRNAGEIKDYVRKYIYELKGKKCWTCGWNKVNSTTGSIPVQIDHIDGDATNNRPENLRLLCPNCHSLTSTYCAIGGRPSTRTKRYVNKVKVSSADYPSSFSLKKKN